MKQVMHIGIDDTDSPRRGCTTYVAALLVEKLTKLGFTFIDYPNLVRLNPNVPWKTRGNGAICLRVEGSNADFNEVFETVVDVVEKESDLKYAGTEPGIVFYQGKEVPLELTAFSKRTIQDVVSMKEALSLIKRFKAEAVGFKSGRGIVGALAAIGETLAGDHTYELIAHRLRENCGTPRKVDPKSVIVMDEKMREKTFNSIDPEKKRILITPRGKDPVLYGIRGESPEVVKEAHEMIKTNEKIERWVIFRTNQGTDAHLRRGDKISQAHPYRPVIVKGTVVEEPRMIPGKHVIFAINDESGQIDCAAYEPTGKFRNTVKKLISKDVVEVYGGVRPPSSKNPKTINLEKMGILSLAPKIVYRNPVCPKCGKRMKSMGRRKGFRCEKCGTRRPDAKKIPVEVSRDTSTGLYLPPPRAHRHLTKPLSRYGKEKSGTTVNLLEEWHYP